MTNRSESADAGVMEPYWFSKEKLSLKLGYPLKRSLLDSALHAASVYDAVYSVRYLGSPVAHSILDAQFVPLGHKGHPRVGGRSLVTICAVPREERKRTEEHVLGEMLPALCDWLAKSQSAGDSWRGMPHFITFKVNGRDLVERMEG